MFEFSRPGAAAGWGRMARCNPNSRMESQRDSSPHLTGEDQCEDWLSENYLALFVYQLMEAGMAGKRSNWGWNVTVYICVAGELCSSSEYDDNSIHSEFMCTSQSLNQSRPFFSSSEILFRVRHPNHLIQLANATAKKGFQSWGVWIAAATNALRVNKMLHII